MEKLAPEERQQIILDLLQSEGKVLAIDLATRLNTTEATIRRDLRYLSDNGLCKRIHGGALAKSAIIATPLERKLISSDEKKALAIAALRLIKNNQVIFLDSSTTHLLLADLLPQDKNLTVVTNSINIAAHLLDRSGIRTIVLGGELNNLIGGAVDSKAIQELAILKFDLALVGVCSWSSESGFSAVDYQDAQFKRMLVDRAGEIAVLCTQDKIDKFAPYKIMDTKDIDHLILYENSDSQLEKQVTAAGGAIFYNEGTV